VNCGDLRASICVRFGFEFSLLELLRVQEFEPIKGPVHAFRCRVHVPLRNSHAAVSGNLHYGEGVRAASPRRVNMVCLNECITKSFLRYYAVQSVGGTNASRFPPFDPAGEAGARTMALGPSEAAPRVWSSTAVLFTTLARASRIFVRFRAGSLLDREIMIDRTLRAMWLRV
jgi:hypothetical protein